MGDISAAPDSGTRETMRLAHSAMMLAHIAVMGSAGTIGVSLLYKSLRRHVPADCRLVLMMCLWLAAFAVVALQAVTLVRPMSRAMTGDCTAERNFAIIYP